MWDRPPDPKGWVLSSAVSDNNSFLGAQGNSPTATNVLQLYRSVLPRTYDGRMQQKWYHSGAERPWFGRFRDGSFGYGLDEAILQGYAYLAATYEGGDDLFIYGFSRGAYTARSLIGLLTIAGLPSPTLLDREHVRRVREATTTLTTTNTPSPHLADCLTEMILSSSNQALNQAYRLYRNVHGNTDTTLPAAPRGRRIQDISIVFLGLWDTVGPLGIPTSALNWLSEHRYNFHDTELSPIVQQACHALAIDEHRADHNATLWTSPARAGQTIEQRWFAGAHGDLGGTYPNRELADFALAWMQRHSMRKGLAIELQAVPEKPNALSPFHDSFSECFGRFRKWFHSRFYRPVMQTGTDTEVLDGSVQTRLLRLSSYRPKNEGLNNLLTFR